jgi:hypothetical protein
LALRTGAIANRFPRIGICGSPLSEMTSSRILGEVASHLLSGWLNTPSALCLTKTAKAAARQKEVAPAVLANTPRPERGAGLSAVSNPSVTPGIHHRGHYLYRSS